MAKSAKAAVRKTKLMPILYQPPKPNKITSPKRDSHDMRMGPLTSYIMGPSDIRFETQEQEEKIILFMRQHVIFLVPTIFLAILLVLAPSVLVPFMLRFMHLPIRLPVGYIIVGTLFWYVAAFGVVLIRFLRWFYNIYIVTDKRVVDIDFVNLLYKEFSEAQLSKIQDMTFKTGGFFSALFNFGNVVIQTAGELPNFDFESVPNPEKVVQTISELIHKSAPSTI